jgi:hypothetical protein
MDDEIALQLIEEPPVKEYTATPPFSEILEPNLTDLEVFLEYWGRSRMDPDAIDPAETETADVVFTKGWQSIMVHFLSVRDELRKMISVVDNLREEKVLKLAGTKFLVPELTNPDVPIGSLIIDKQLQLQGASKLLQQAIEEIVSKVDPSVRKFRELDRLSHHFTITFALRLCTDRRIPLVATFLRPMLHIVLETAEMGDVFWTISRPAFIALNGQTILPHINSPYPDLLCRVVLEVLFADLKRDLAASTVDYTTNESSNAFSIVIGDEKLEFSQTDRNASPLAVCPPYIPLLGAGVFSAGSRPYKTLRGGLEDRRNIRVFGNIVLNAFIGCDFCKMSSTDHGHSAVYHIDSLYLTPLRHGKTRSTETITVCIANGKVIASDPLFPLMSQTINCSATDAEAVMQRWCADQYWRLYMITVSAIAGRFGFIAEMVKGHFVAHGENGRDLQFQLHSPDRLEITVIVKQHGTRLSLRWQALPVTGHYHRLSYLFFYPFFKQ